MLSLIPWKRNLPQAEETRMFPLSAFRRDMDRLFDRFLDVWGESDGLFGDPIRLEVCETEEEIRVIAEVPGVEPGDLNVQLVGDLLILAGEKKDQVDEQRGARTYSERSFGSFRKSLRLNAPVDPDRVRAEHKNGVVTITLTKSESVRPKRIQVRSA
jgi:HSP20 family protein